MKEYIINNHAWHCDCSTDNNTRNAWICSHNPERFLFFLGNQFYLITFYKCLQTDYQFKKDLVEKCCKDFKIFPEYKIEKSVDVCRELKNFRLKNQALKTIELQINYLYNNNAGKSFAITTETNFFDNICNQDIIDKNYKEAKDFLNEKGYTFLLDSLDLLYRHNKVYVLDNQEIYKSIDHLIQSINHQTI